MDPELKKAIEAAENEKKAKAAADQEAAWKAVEEANKKHQAELEAYLPKAREYVRNIVFPLIAKAIVEGQKELELGDRFGGCPFQPRHVLVAALREVEGLSANEAQGGTGQFDEGYGYDTYECVIVRWR